MGKQGKILLALALALIMVLAMTVTALADDYSSHWSAEFSKKAVEKGWITADSNGNIAPDALSTRAEYVLMLWKALGQPAPKNACPFTDIPADANYRNAATAMYEAGVTTGITATTFGGGLNLTREMSFTMLARAYSLTPTNTLAYQQFTDHATISDWARNAVSVLFEKGYISGVGNNACAPKQNLKRGEMIKIVIGVYDGVEAARQLQMASMAAIVQVQASGTLSLSLSLQVMASNEVTVVVDAKDSDNGLNFIGWRKHTETNYTSTTSFTSIGTSNPEFTVNENDTYAVGIGNKKGGFTYKTITVKDIIKESDAPMFTLSAATPVNGQAVITVKTSPGSKTIKEVRYISSVVDAKTTYSSIPNATLVNNFDKNTNTGTFNVSGNGLYVVFVEYDGGKFAFKKIDVTGFKNVTSYTVTFDSQGGSAVASQTVDDGGKVIKPTDPTYAGYTFGGWYKEAACTNAWNFNTDTVSQKTTLYAKWTLNAAVITTNSLADGKVNTAYSQTLAASGGATITWSITAGSLPAGLTLNGNTISGTPTADGTFNFSVTATNTAGSDTKALSIKVDPALVAPSITSQPPDGTVNTLYNYTMTATGDMPITWAVSGPVGGLTINTNTGEISGTPDIVGTVTVTATNAAGSDTKTFNIN